MGKFIFYFMTNPEDKPREAPPQEKEKPTQPQPEKSPSELREERLMLINQELDAFGTQTSQPEEIQQIQEQREQEYQAKVAELEQGLGTQLGDESKDLIHENMVDSAIEQARKDNERFDNLQRLKKAAETLLPEDFLYFEHILGNKEGNTENLFDVVGKAMHTTNDFYFKKMLESGSIRTGTGQEGMYQSKGASFTDGDFPEAATFQTLFDDQNTHSSDKRFDSGKYSDKAHNFVKHLWDTKGDEFKTYLSKISGGKKIDTFEDALLVAEGFKFKANPKEIADDPEKLSQLYGVTIVYDKDKLPELEPKQQDGDVSEFELLSFREGGVPLTEASAIFVPESQIEKMRQLLEAHGLSQVEIRPSEELEVIRILKLLDKK